MGIKTKFFIVLVAFSAFWGYKIYLLLAPPSPPNPVETWWGKSDPSHQTDKSIRPYKVNIADEILTDLKYRLDHHRRPPPPLEPTQWYGINSNLLEEIVDFWRAKYDWKQREKLFNQFPQYVTNIQGLDIHYIHVKPKATPPNGKILPLLLLHGWPGSIREFFDVIPLLTTPTEDRDFVFEVIVPSLPGYGFSEAAVKPGLGSGEVAVIFKNLMARLGFEKYYVQGGDFGAIILHAFSILFPEKVLGFHSNMCVLLTPLSQLKIIIGSLWPSFIVKEEHIDRVYPVTKLCAELLYESGYLHEQATKPDTLGTALRDSPVGLAAYILEKFIIGTNKTYRGREDGGLKLHYKYEDLLDNVMVYWVTGSMPTAIRLYSETFNKKILSQRIPGIPIKIPTACVRFEHDFYFPDGVLDEIYTNLVQLTDHDGGHFAAFQVPAVFTKDIYSAVEKFEKFNADRRK